MKQTWRHTVLLFVSAQGRHFWNTRRWPRKLYTYIFTLLLNAVFFISKIFFSLIYVRISFFFLSRGIGRSVINIFKTLRSRWNSFFYRVSTIPVEFLGKFYVLLRGLFLACQRFTEIQRLARKILYFIIINKMMI